MKTTNQIEASAPANVRPSSVSKTGKAEANRLLMAMNEAGKQPAMNLSLARVYLRHSDPLVFHNYGRA